ncbi:MAG: hypothetical protein WC521_05665 [Bdellovibrionales bacterium]
MAQVHLIYSTKSDVPNSDILCDATDGSTYRVFNTSNNMDESLVKLMDDGSSKNKKPSDFRKSEKTYDLNKLVYLMVNGKQAVDLSITGQMNRMNLSEDERVRVRAAYANQFSTVAPKVLTEEQREEANKLAEEREKSRTAGGAKTSELVTEESAWITPPTEPSAKTSELAAEESTRITKPNKTTTKTPKSTRPSKKIAAGNVNNATGTRKKAPHP